MTRSGSAVKTKANTAVGSVIARAIGRLTSSTYAWLVSSLGSCELCPAALPTKTANVAMAMKGTGQRAWFRSVVSLTVGLRLESVKLFHITGVDERYLKLWTEPAARLALLSGRCGTGCGHLSVIVSRSCCLTTTSRVVWRQRRRRIVGCVAHIGGKCLWSGLEDCPFTGRIRGLRRSGRFRWSGHPLTFNAEANNWSEF